MKKILTILMILTYSIIYEQTVGVSDVSTFSPTSLLQVKATTFVSDLFTINKKLKN